MNAATAAAHPLCRYVPVTLRQAGESDARTLSQFLHTTFLAANGHCSSPDNVEAFLASAYNETAQRQEIADPMRITLIARTFDGRWAGVAQVRLDAEIPDGVHLRRAVELSRLYVAAPFHGCGVAQRLLDQVVIEARKFGADGVWLHAWSQAPQALAFYAKEGFRIVGETTFVVGDDAKHNWIFVREFVLGAAHADEPTIRMRRLHSPGSKPMDTAKTNLDIALRYLASVGQAGADTLGFYADDVVQVEHPNRLLPDGATRDLSQLHEAAVRGAKVMRSQTFEVVDAIASGDNVAVQAKWTGILAVPFGTIPAGGAMTARFAIFLTFRDGKIVRQDNYDCFDAW